MKRKVLLSADDQAVDQSPSQLPVLKPVGKLNPAPSESNQETSFIPTKEEKETITMKDDSMPSIETSFFSGSSDELDAAEDGRIDWTKPKQREEESDLMKHLVKKFQSSTPGVGGEDELVSTTENNEHNGDVKVDQQKIFKFVHEGNPIRGPVASGQTLVMKPGNQQATYSISGDAASYVHHNNMHLHGAIMQMGSSATNAQEAEGFDPALGVTGFLPQALEFLVKSARSAAAIQENDGDGRPYQFGVITVLGGSDHDKITKAMASEPTQGLIEALGNLNLVSIKDGYYVKKNLHFVKSYVNITPILFNNLGYVSILEVSFGKNKEMPDLPTGKHYIYLHRANDIGGGKSDHTLREGRTGRQATALAEEFEWWKAALTLAGGKIGSLETTLGGTARIGRYALLQAKVPRPLFTTGAIETILLDDAAWVKDNLGNTVHEYRANYATTMLRAAYGSQSKRLNNVRLDIAHRKDPVQRRLRQTTCIEATLRNLFPGEPTVDPMFMDISDERTEILSQEDIIYAKQTVIHDPVATNPKGPWEMNRHTRVTVANSFSFGEIFNLALGQRTDETIEEARAMFESARGLATSGEDVLEPGGFCILDIYVPAESLNESTDQITSRMIEQVKQALASAFKQAGSDKVLTHCHKVPGYSLPNAKRVYVRMTEYQAAHNMLMVSNEDAGSREKRTIMTDPALEYIEDRHYAHVNSFARLFSQLIEGHEKSGYRYAEEDANLLKAFYRHFYGNNFGNQPNLLLGGLNRPKKK